MLPGGLKIEWASDPAQVQFLARFVADNINQSYISHSEVMSGRATEFDRWADDLLNQCESEYAAILASVHTPFLTGSRLAIVTAGMENLLGVIVIGFCGSGDSRHAVIEDMVVRADMRGKGLGRMMMNWSKETARNMGCKRLFLESGITNHNAHDFFQQAGFQPISKIFHNDLRVGGLAHSNNDGYSQNL